MYIYSVCPQFFNCLSLRNSLFGSAVPGGSRARYTTVSAPIGAQQHVVNYTHTNKEPEVYCDHKFGRYPVPQVILTCSAWLMQ